MNNGPASTDQIKAYVTAHLPESLDPASATVNASFLAPSWPALQFAPWRLRIQQAHRVAPWAHSKKIPAAPSRLPYSTRTILYSPHPDKPSEHVCYFRNGHRSLSASERFGTCTLFALSCFRLQKETRTRRSHISLQLEPCNRNNWQIYQSHIFEAISVEWRLSCSHQYEL